MDQYQDVMDKARDNRTVTALKSDIQRGNARGYRAMQSFSNWLSVNRNGGKFVYFKYFWDRYWEDMGEIKMHHDANLYWNDTVIPFGIKTDIANPITSPFFLRYAEMKHLANLDGKLLIANRQSFTVQNAKKIIKRYSVSRIAEWGNKYCYIVHPEHFKFYDFVIPVVFE